MRDDLKPLDYYPWFWQVARADRRWQALSWYQRGALRELFDECWSEGGIPDNPNELALIVRCTLGEMNEMWRHLRPFFQVAVHAGFLSNRRLEKLRTKKDQERVIRIKAGRQGGKAKASAQIELLASASTGKAKKERREEKRRGKESKEEVPALAMLADSDAEQIVIDRWNEFADKVGFPKVVSYNATRKRALKSRLREKGWFDRIAQALTFLEKSEWHRANPIAFDTFLRPGKVDAYFERALTTNGAAASRSGARAAVDGALPHELDTNLTAGRRATNGSSDSDEDVFRLR